MGDTDHKIVIVSSDLESLDGLISMLSQEYKEIYVAQDWGHALQVVADAQPDVLILDGLSGMASTDSHAGMVALIDTVQASIIVITETSSGARALPATGMPHAGRGFGHLEKPIRTVEAIALIRAHVELCRLHTELRARETRLLEESERRMRVEARLDELVASNARGASEGQLERPGACEETVHPCAEVEEERPLDKLSRREHQVLHLLVEGLTSVDIGRLLDLSDATVRTYRSRLMNKLEAESFAELIKMSVHWGIV